MSWAKLDDQFPYSAKVAALTDSEFRLHVSALCHCAAQLTDGFVAEHMPNVFPRCPGRGSIRNAILHLESVNLWERTAGGWVIHDYLDWNPSAEAVKAKKAARAAAGARGGSAKRKQLPKQNGSNCLDDASRLLVTCSKQTRTPSPSPSPDLLPSVEMLSSSLALDAGVLEQPVEFVAGNPTIAAEARRVFEAWKLDTGHVRATLDRKRQVRIEARLREGFTADELILAITHRRNDPWLMGTAEGATRVFDGIETLLRDAAQVERLRDLDKPLQTVRRGPGPVQKDRGNNQFFSIEKLRAEGAITTSSVEPCEYVDDIAF